MTALKNNARKTRASKKVAAPVIDATETDVSEVLRDLAVETGAVDMLSMHNVEIAPLDASKSLAVIDSAVDAETVSEVLEALDSVIDATDADAARSLRDIALSFDQVDVDAMNDNIRATFDARDAFEVSRGLDIADSTSSYAKARKFMLANVNTVSRAFLALNVEPVNVIRRKVVSSNEFSAKGLDKVTEFALFICGNTARFQKVSQAFIACSIACADRDAGAIGNKVNKQFLSNASFDRLIADAELRDYLRDYQHKYMTGGKDTQSSQVRNVLDVLGLGTIVTVEHSRGGIEINRDHGFYQLFRERYMTRATA